MILCLVFFSVFNFISSLNFSDFWERKATSWKFLTKLKFGGGMNCGTHFVTRGNTWYLFHREYYSEPYPGCEHRDNAKVVVMKSTDKGTTWTEKTDVGVPDRSSEYSTCAVVDGGGFYDEETNTWHYISQCLGATKGWALCHYSFVGDTPIGEWKANPANPVVIGGDLFKKICSGKGKHCLPGMVDEGTPDIVEKIDGEFYVTFHGYDYQRKVGARGVAATPDFVHWRVEGKHLPDDVIFSAIDCQNWNISWDPKTGCIGGGEGSTLVEDGYKYMLIEAPDEELGCLTQIGVQNWVLGLVRSKTYSPSGTWEQFSVNPTIVPVIKKGCMLQYHRIFKDEVGVYLSFWVYGEKDYNMQIYQLQEGQGPLPIVADA